MNLDFAENIIWGINLLGILFFLSSPFLFYYLLKGRMVMRGIFLILFWGLNLFVLSFIAIILVYWSVEYAPQLLLHYFGFEYQEIGDSFKNVLPENKERLRQIYDSLFGVPWGIKFIGVWIFSVLPYSFVSSIIIYFINKKQK